MRGARLRALGFYLNPGKTKWLPADRRQLVTGIVVNKSAMSRPKSAVHYARSCISAKNLASPATWRERDRRTGGPLPGSAPGPGQLPAADHAGKAGAAGSPGLADQSTAAIRRRRETSPAENRYCDMEKAGTSRRCSRFFSTHVEYTVGKLYTGERDLLNEGPYGLCTAPQRKILWNGPAGLSNG